MKSSPAVVGNRYRLFVSFLQGLGGGPFLIRHTAFHDSGIRQEDPILQVLAHHEVRQAREQAPHLPSKGISSRGVFAPMGVTVRYRYVLITTKSALKPKERVDPDDPSNVWDIVSNALVTGENQMHRFRQQEPGGRDRGRCIQHKPCVVLPKVFNFAIVVPHHGTLRCVAFVRERATVQLVCSVEIKNVDATEQSSCS